MSGMICYGQSEKGGRNTSLQSPASALLQAAGNALAADLSTPAHIVVVEDDGPLRALIARLLREGGHRVTGVADGRQLSRLMNRAADQQIDLLLLDIMLPGEDGLTLCQRIRATSPMPIIMISARGKEADRVAGLDAGADDYLAKPFGRSELLARVRAVLRRAAMGTPQQGPGSKWLCFAGWRYHVGRQQLYAPGDVRVVLTAAENDLLLVLLRNPQCTLGRERLLELSRQRIGNSTDRSIDVLISRLRRKLEGAAEGGEIIRTVRGVGYMFTADVSAG
jgi:DNA-binding response OmpR family regulator|tara:strand:+ start:42229 stop:43065 length:837 start_codon:yes stop_codon:yes gene_type:complete